MADKLTPEQKAAHAHNALQKLDHPAFFSRLAAHGIHVTEKDAAEYIALGEELLEVTEAQERAANSGSGISAARAALHKRAAEQGIKLGASAADQQLDGEIRQFAATKLGEDEALAATLASLV